MKKLLKIAIVVAIAAMFASCTKESLKGSGDNRTEVRDLSQFDVVHLSGLREAEIILSNDWKVEMTGYSNLLHHFESRVTNGNLHFLFPHHHVVRNDNIKVKIYTPGIVKIYQSGNTKVKVGNGFQWDELGIYLSGNSHFEVAGGRANTFRADASGNAKIFARPLVAKTAKLHVSGLVQAEVAPTNYLYVEGSGKTRVRYWGSPNAVDVRTSGDARVMRQ